MSIHWNKRNPRLEMIIEDLGLSLDDARSHEKVMRELALCDEDLFWALCDTLGCRYMGDKKGWYRKGNPITESQIGGLVSDYANRISHM